MSVYMVDLTPVEYALEKWLNANAPTVTAFFDYQSILEPVLEVVFGLSRRKELIQQDLLGLTSWGFSSLMIHEFVTIAVETIENLCLISTGERVNCEWYRYQLMPLSRLAISDAI